MTKRYFTPILFVSRSLSLVIAMPLLVALQANAQNTVDSDFANTFDCILQPSQEVELSTAVYGVLSEVLVNRGDTVTKGQLLASLVSGTEKAVVKIGRANLGFADRSHARIKGLFDQAMVGGSEMDQAETEMLMAKLRLEQSEEQFKLREVHSPIAGVVIERDKEPGEYVETQSVLTVVRLDPLFVEVVVPSDSYGTISAGTIGQVRTLGPLESTYVAEVTLIDQVIDAASDTLRVRLTLNNPGNKIPAGLNCTVSFQ